MKKGYIPDDIIKIIQHCISLRPVIIIGSGASCKYNFPNMSELSSFLLKEIIPSKSIQSAWDILKGKIISGTDLETALHDVTLTKDLENDIVNKTRQLFLENDRKLFKDVLRPDFEFPLSILLKHLIRTANPCIKIMTTNYDRIIEYAIDKAYLPFYCGFSGYLLKYFSGFDSITERDSHNSIILLKVHGSIDWFVDNESNVFSISDDTSTPKEYTPLLVTPGIRKYEHTHNEPFRSIISKADDAFKNANSILCIGYGFNDIHLQPKLNERMRKTKLPVLILSKTLTSNALSFIRLAANINVIGIQESTTGSTIIQSLNKDAIQISETLWQLSDIIKYVI